MTSFSVVDRPLPGVVVLECPHFTDHRGSFTKLFNADAFQAQGIDFSAAESFFTYSKTNVLRGMHYQAGKAAHDKLVCCLAGSVLDVVVDICPSSPTFNKPFSIQLTEGCTQALLIGKGYAHGFLALEDNSCMLYYTSTVHSPDQDCGVLWSSIDFEWPLRDPLISGRDRFHPHILLQQ